MKSLISIKARNWFHFTFQSHSNESLDIKHVNKFYKLKKYGFSPKTPPKKQKDKKGALASENKFSKKTHEEWRHPPQLFSHDENNRDLNLTLTSLSWTMLFFTEHFKREPVMEMDFFTKIFLRDDFEFERKIPQGFSSMYWRLWLWAKKSIW